MKNRRNRDCLITVAALLTGMLFAVPAQADLKGGLNGPRSRHIGEHAGLVCQYADLDGAAFEVGLRRDGEEHAGKQRRDRN